MFTSAQPVGSRQSGDWGGLIFVGNGIDNRSGTVNVEGTGTSADNPLIQYNGGNNNADNSGTLKYVRIEFGGIRHGPGRRIQHASPSRPSAAGPPSTTWNRWPGWTIASSSGAARSTRKHMICYDSGDDGFDMSEGYVGRLQYLIVYDSRLIIPRPNAGFTSQDPQGIENDGCAGSGCDLAFNSTPFTVPVIANFTLVGTGPGRVPSRAAGTGRSCDEERGATTSMASSPAGPTPRLGIGTPNPRRGKPPACSASRTS